LEAVGLFGDLRCLSSYMLLRRIVVLAVMAKTVCACECVSGPVCQDLAPLVFIGTVTDITGSEEDLFAEIQKKLTPEQLGRMERREEFSLSEMKEIIGMILPAPARAAIQAAETKSDLEGIVGRFVPALSLGFKQVQFQVEETFRGVNQPVREVWTGQGGGDCGFPFKRGKKYIVLASPSDEPGRFVTGMCGHTREISEAGEELTYLRSAQRRETDTRVYGVVTRNMEDVEGSTKSSPLAGAMVRIESDTGLRETVSGKDGGFELNYLTPGDYKLSVIAEGFSFSETPVKFHLETGRCVKQVVVGKAP